MVEEKITLGHVGFDLDDSLINLIDPLNDFFNRLKGTKLKVKDYTTYNLSMTWGVSREEVLEISRLFCQSEFHDTIERVEGGYEAVEYLKEKHKLSVITGRGTEFEKFSFDTLSRLYKADHFANTWHLGLPGDIGVSTQKWEKCKENDISLLIDDYDVHLCRAAEKDIHGILLLAPWNKNITDLPTLVARARNMSEAVEIIEKKEKIIFR